MNNEKKKLSAKDLIVTGVFAVLLLMAAMLGEGPFATADIDFLFSYRGSCARRTDIYALYSKGS